MRKTLITFILVISIFSMMFGVNAEVDKARFVIQTPEVLVRAGEEFEVTLELENNPGFSAFQFILEYDKSLMQCENVVVGEVLKGTLSATNHDNKGGAAVAAASLNAITKNGTVAHCYFVAKEDITEYKFKLKDILFVDEDNNDIEYEAEDEEVSDLPEVLPEEDKEPEKEVTNNRPSGGGSIRNEEVTVPEEITPTEETTPLEEEVVDTGIVKENPFSDVVGHWAEEYVVKAVELGLFKGDTDGNFRPNDNVTRAQFVTVLWRMAGRPETEAEVPFGDIDNQIPEFKTAIIWGYENGYINGTSDITFSPDATLTREAGMKILHYFSGGESGEEVFLYDVYNGLFKDSSDISDWAMPSVYWGVYNKIISGVSSDTLSPKGTATRAQLAKILVNYLGIK